MNLFKSILIWILCFASFTSFSVAQSKGKSVTASQYRRSSFTITREQCLNPHLKYVAPNGDRYFFCDPELYDGVDPDLRCAESLKVYSVDGNLRFDQLFRSTCSGIDAHPLSNPADINGFTPIRTLLQPGGTLLWIWIAGRIIELDTESLTIVRTLDLRSVYQSFNALFPNPQVQTLPQGVLIQGEARVHVSVYDGYNRYYEAKFLGSYWVDLEGNITPATAADGGTYKVGDNRILNVVKDRYRVYRPKSNYLRLCRMPENSCVNSNQVWALQYSEFDEFSSQENTFLGSVFGIRTSSRDAVNWFVKNGRFTFSYLKKTARVQAKNWGHVKILKFPERRSFLVDSKSSGSLPVFRQKSAFSFFSSTKSDPIDITEVIGNSRDNWLNGILNDGSILWRSQRIVRGETVTKLYIARPRNPGTNPVNRSLR